MLESFPPCRLPSGPNTVNLAIYQRWFFCNDQFIQLVDYLRDKRIQFVRSNQRAVHQARPYSQRYQAKQGQASTVQDALVNGNQRENFYLGSNFEAEVTLKALQPQKYYYSKDSISQVPSIYPNSQFSLSYYSAEIDFKAGQDGQAHLSQQQHYFQGIVFSSLCIFRDRQSVRLLCSAGIAFCSFQGISIIPTFHIFASDFIRSLLGFRFRFFPGCGLSVEL